MSRSERDPDRDTDGAISFWKQKSLSQMTPKEWESLCDGCGKCCLHKLEDIDTGEIAFTNVVCRLMEMGSCRCSRYEDRARLMPDCVTLTPEKLERLNWMPSTCAYRLLNEGKELYDWHPLISGDSDSVHRAGISIRGRAISERSAGPLEHHVLEKEP
jgi:uncharacterized cysteine cluster protein YcgN (CxxCxxCC family)